MPSIFHESNDAVRAVRQLLEELNSQGGSITAQSFWAASQGAYNVPSKALVTAMKRFVPVRTGRLRDSIGKENFPSSYRRGRKPTRTAGVVVLPIWKKGGRHRWLVEHGHGGPKPAPAKPYLEKSIQASLSGVRSGHIRKFEGRVRTLVRNARKKIKANGGK